MQHTDIEQLSKNTEQFENARVLVIGDLILDNFIYGEVTRVSPEAPVPILHISREAQMLGGAGNVVRNVTALGGKCTFISVVGNDAPGQSLIRMIGEDKEIEAYVHQEKERITTLKSRYVAGNQQLLRADNETKKSITTTSEKQIISFIKSAVKNVDVVLLSDYAKGVLTDKIITSTIALAKKEGKTVIVDPKRHDFSVYAGADIITPNTLELEAATGLPTDTNEALEKAAKKLQKAHAFGTILVTRSKKGMAIVPSEGKPQFFAAAAKEVFDVSGAGDTVLATLGIALASGLPLTDSVFLANVAGGIVVGRIGTTEVFRTDLKTALLTHELATSTRKILPQHNALQHIAHWRDGGKKVGFTNGCFDLIHPGHVSLMEQAKAQCDRLVVGLNSDDSVKRLKGDTRPVQNEMSRAMVLASLEAVDMVVIFREDTPIKLIEAITPDVLVKGKDYTVDTVVGSEYVLKNGGEIFLADISEGQSTSNLVEKIAH
jgi:D-beta-D-heptose 7-phosphate kinase/D-beta-D-heptose 1-phosphate adenosyltransferase